MSCLTCGFIGLGLIGGSIAKALKENIPGVRIIAYDISQDALRLAAKETIADLTVDIIDERFSECDYIFLCAPVRKNDTNLAVVKHILKPGCLLTDVGSVKSGIHQTVRKVGLEDCFIGGHPMAGSERTGFLNAKAALLENAYYILTPTASVSSDKVNAFRDLVSAMHAIPLIMNAQQHDYITAAISHLPHVIAASLVNLVRESDSEEGIMKMIAAGGFKDITRIASSQAAMWQQICLSNSVNLSSLLSAYIQKLTDFQNILDEKSVSLLYEQFENARIYRDSFLNASSGPIKRAFCISVEIADKSGALAHITTLLAQNGLNIKNIGITHNRESDDGVLKVEFYDETAMLKAADILNAAAYSVIVRT